MDKFWVMICILFLQENDTLFIKLPFQMFQMPYDSENLQRNIMEE